MKHETGTKHTLAVVEMMFRQVCAMVHKEPCVPWVRDCDLGGGGGGVGGLG